MGGAFKGKVNLVIMVWIQADNKRIQIEKYIPGILTIRATSSLVNNGSGFV